MKSLADIRKNYSRSALDITDVDKNPIHQFGKWFDEAMQSHALEPNAFTLATATAEGRPSARIVLLKGIEDGKFVFYTNYQSEKGKALENNPACALTFFWPELERQVRIEGTAARVSENLSTAYFQSRPRESQIGAWASPQSSLIANREILEERVNQLRKRFEGEEKLPKPSQWGGFAVEPFQLEFWQGRPNRLHDRIQYTLTDGAWHIHRLAP